MNEIDCIIAGFCGGTIASLIVILSYYQFIRTKTIHYIRENDDLKSSVRIIVAEKKIKDLEKQMKDIYSELNDHYKS